MLLYTEQRKIVMKNQNVVVKIKFNIKIFQCLDINLEILKEINKERQRRLECRDESQIKYETPTNIDKVKPKSKHFEERNGSWIQSNKQDNDLSSSNTIFDAVQFPLCLVPLVNLEESWSLKKFSTKNFM